MVLDTGSTEEFYDDFRGICNDTRSWDQRHRTPYESLPNTIPHIHQLA
jgi:hypothetical protein